MSMERGMRFSSCIGILGAGMAVAVGVFGSCESASAQDGGKATSLEFKLQVGVWLPRLGGESSLGAGGESGVKLSYESGRELDDQEPTFNVELAIVKDRFWEVHLSGFDFSTDGAFTWAGSSRAFGTLSLDGGDEVEGSVDLFSLAAELNLAVWKPLDHRQDNFNSNGERTIDFRIKPGVAVRYVSVEESLEIDGEGREEGEGDWFGVMGSIGVDLRWLPENRPAWFHSLEVSGALAAGPAFGGDGGFMWQVRAGVTANFTPNLGVTFGYRLLWVDAEGDDDYEFDGTLQGLFLSAAVQF